MVAARLQHGEDHQIGVRKKPLLGFGPGGFGSARDRSQVLILRELAQMVSADAREGDDFIFGEDFLARLDSHHDRPPTYFDAANKLNAANVASNSPSVLGDQNFLVPG